MNSNTVTIMIAVFGFFIYDTLCTELLRQENPYLLVNNNNDLLLWRWKINLLKGRDSVWLRNINQMHIKN